MHTEEQAKHLWCPMVRHEGDSNGTFNRGWCPSNPLNSAGQAEQSYMCNCLASGCAMWRWHNPKEKRLGFCGMSGSSHVQLTQPSEPPLATHRRALYWRQRV
jgi:hypothetical protein